jgi:UDP-N-acetylglucosamine:LPS N-acetylglucosamine transferase
MSQPNNTKKYAFYICGLTGGPFLPIPAVIQKYSDLDPVLVGVKNSFEQKASLEMSIPIMYLPNAKLNIASFGKKNIVDYIAGIFDFVLTLFKLLFSIVLSLVYVVRFKPELIFGSGSFLSVPIVFVTVFTNWVGITKVKIWIHQMDPMPGIANKLCIKFASIKTCLFQYTIDNYPKFKDCKVIDCPLIKNKYDQNNPWKNKELESYIKRESKPKLLIFGGGSGSVAINNWVKQNLVQLKSKFLVIHLSGAVNDKDFEIPNDKEYYGTKAVFEDMPLLLGAVDVVICRAGVGSISELRFLHKKAFLVPLPNSHQELNAKLVESEFVTLHQSDVRNWLETIFLNI